jgi:hypothetical protein
MVASVLCELSHLKCYRAPYCWREGASEVNFLIEENTGIIPIALQSGQSYQAKILSVLIKKYQPRHVVKPSGRFPNRRTLDDGYEHLPLHGINRYPAGVKRHLPTRILLSSLKRVKLFSRVRLFGQSENPPTIACKTSGRCRHRHRISHGQSFFDWFLWRLFFALSRTI